jgi:hypothetical protein
MLEHLSNIFIQKSLPSPGGGLEFDFKMPHLFKDVIPSKSWDHIVIPSMNCHLE